MSVVRVFEKRTGKEETAMNAKVSEERSNPARGYRPLALTLTGFKGIKSGLGRETVTLDLETLVGDATLVAIAGANGRGKTTLLENLQPLC